MPPKQHFFIKNEITNFFLKNLLKTNTYFLVSYKPNTIKAVKSITKDQICNSLYEIVNRKTEKFPLNMINFAKLTNLVIYMNSKPRLIISLVKIKNIFFKGKSKIKAATVNLTTLYISLIKKYFLLKNTNNYETICC